MWFVQLLKRRKGFFPSYSRKEHAAWALFGENRAGQLDCTPKMSGAILSERSLPVSDTKPFNQRTRRRRTKKLRRFLRTLHAKSARQQIWALRLPQRAEGPSPRTGRVQGS